MAYEFEMSMIRKLSYLLGLQIKQIKNDTFTTQGIYINKPLKKFGMDKAKSMYTSIETNGHLDLYKWRNNGSKGTLFND